jgi:hypothetical protein
MSPSLVLTTQQSVLPWGDGRSWRCVRQQQPRQGAMQPAFARGFCFETLDAWRDGTYTFLATCGIYLAYQQRCYGATWKGSWQNNLSP